VLHEKEKPLVRYGVLATSAVILMAVTPCLARGAEAPKRCDPAGRRTVLVALAPPSGVALAGVKVRLDYPEEAVVLPGRGDDADVKAHVTDMPTGVLGVPNDEDDALVVALVSTTPLPSGRIFTVAFEACRGAGAVGADRFRCTVEEASNEQGKLVSGATCTVTLRHDIEGEKS
jgi:hypothetical protein